MGENPNADKNEWYMCCFVENNAIFERYSEVLVSDDFAEIAKVFGQRVADAAEEIIREMKVSARRLARTKKSRQKAATLFQVRIPSRTR